MCDRVGCGRGFAVVLVLVDMRHYWWTFDMSTKLSTPASSTETCCAYRSTCRKKLNIFNLFRHVERMKKSFDMLPKTATCRTATFDMSTQRSTCCFDMSNSTCCFDMLLVWTGLNRKSTTRFPMSLRWSSYVASKPPKRVQNAKKTDFHRTSLCPPPHHSPHRQFCFLLYWQNIQTSSISWCSLYYNVSSLTCVINHTSKFLYFQTCHWIWSDSSQLS